MNPCNPEQQLISRGKSNRPSIDWVSWVIEEHGGVYSRGTRDMIGFQMLCFGCFSIGYSARTVENWLRLKANGKAPKWENNRIPFATFIERMNEKQTAAFALITNGTRYEIN